jgi:hypothetical protein
MNACLQAIGICYYALLSVTQVPVYAMCTIRSQSVGAAEGAMGDGGGSCYEEAVGECPPPRLAAEETQATLSVSVQKPCMCHLKYTRHLKTHRILCQSYLCVSNLMSFY